MKLGRLGVWYSTDKLDGWQLRDFVRTVENNGYSNLWYPESRGYESMSLASWLLSSSEKLVDACAEWRQVAWRCPIQRDAAAYG
jgi:hypothetical protein